MKSVRKSERTKRLKPINRFNQEGNSYPLPMYADATMEKLYKHGFLKGIRLA